MNHCCDLCDHKGRSNINLHKHIKLFTENCIFKCDYCAHVHEGLRGKCELCGLRVTMKTQLKAHVKVDHEGIAYKCEQCDFQQK